MANGTNGNGNKILLVIVGSVSATLLGAALLAVASHVSNAEKHETKEQKSYRVRSEVNRHYEDVVKPDLRLMEGRLTNEIERLREDLRDSENGP